MIEEYEFRIWEDKASKLFTANEGERRGSLTRRIKILKRDERFEKIGELQRKLRRDEGSLFFTSWAILRKYNKGEISSAGLFEFSPLAYFEPFGEECGTIYDETTACLHCGAGATQRGPLFLDLSRIPKKPDIATTIAREIVVNQHFVDVFKDNNITGVSFHPVRQKKMTDLRPTGWYQFVVAPPLVSISQPTRIGIDPFDEDEAGKYRCPCGDTIGLNILSEITIDAMPSTGVDVFQSIQFVGRRQGFLRQFRSIFVTQKVKKAIDDNNIRGVRFEVVHVIE